LAAHEHERRLAIVRVKELLTCADELALGDHRTRFLAFPQSGRRRIAAKRGARVQRGGTSRPAAISAFTASTKPAPRSRVVR
jgi:hypothetical protein